MDSDNVVSTATIASEDAMSRSPVVSRGGSAPSALDERDALELLGLAEGWGRKKVWREASVFLTAAARRLRVEDLRDYVRVWEFSTSSSTTTAADYCSCIARGLKKVSLEDRIVRRTRERETKKRGREEVELGSSVSTKRTRVRLAARAGHASVMPEVGAVERISPVEQVAASED